MYESELTRFIRELLEKNPQHRRAAAQELRATWWDKPQDLEIQKERAESAVPAASLRLLPAAAMPPTKD